MSQSLADPVTVARVAKELFPELLETDPAEAALLTLAWLAKINANGNGK